MFWRPSVLWVVIVALLLSTPGASAQQASRGGPRLDYYGDPLPPGAVARLGTKRLQTKGGFGWTPDGKSLATLRGGTVYFWDLADGHCRETLLVPINPDPFYTYGTKFALSKDGQKLVCADRLGCVATWDLATSQMAAQPASKERSEEIAAVAIHPDGKQFVTLRSDGELQFCELATCRMTRSVKLKVHCSEDSIVSFSPDGKALALHGGGTSIHLLDAELDAEPTLIRRAHGQSLHHIEFLSDGRLCSVGTKRGPAGTADGPQPQNQLLIWDLGQQPPSSREILLGGELLPAGCSAALSADGRTLVTVHNDRVVVWEVAGERILRTIEGSVFRNAMDAVVKIDPTGKFVAVDDRQNYVRIWELATGKPVLSTEQHHQSGVCAADWLPDGTRIATGGFEGEVRVWDAASGEPLVKFRGTDWGVFSVRYTPDATQLVLCGDQPGLFHPKLGTKVSGPVRWHDAESGKRLREAPLPARARLLTPSPDGSWIAVATYGIEGPGEDPFGGDAGRPTVRLLDAKNGTELGKFDLDKGQTQSLAWSADSKTVFVATGTKVIQLDAQSLKPAVEAVLPHLREDQRTKLLMESSIFQAAFLRQGGGIVTTGGLREIYGWKLPTGAKEWTIKTDDLHYRGLSLSPDERLLAAVCTAADQSLKLRLFDVPARRLITTFDLGRETADRALFSPDSNRLLVGFYDGTALIYDVSATR